MTRDPGGTLVDVVEQIAPAPGYWDQYRAAARRGAGEDLPTPGGDARGSASAT